MTFGWDDQDSPKILRSLLRSLLEDSKDEPDVAFGNENFLEFALVWCMIVSLSPHRECTKLKFSSLHNLYIIRNIIMYIKYTRRTVKNSGFLWGFLFSVRNSRTFYQWSSKPHFLKTLYLQGFPVLLSMWHSRQMDGSQVHLHSNRQQSDSVRPILIYLPEKK